MNIANRIMEKSKEKLLTLENALNHIKLPRTNKVMVASSYYSICMEHYRSIISLIELRLYSSASALLRCLFESYIKGLWFYYCSKESDISSLKENKFGKTFNSLIREIEVKKGNGLSNAKNNNWCMLNGLTHSGTEQISRRIIGDQIVPNYSEGFVEDAINFANNYGLLAAGELALISDNQAAQAAVLKFKDS